MTPRRVGQPTSRRERCVTPTFPTLAAYHVRAPSLDGTPPHPKCAPRVGGRTRPRPLRGAARVPRSIASLTDRGASEERRVPIRERGEQRGRPATSFSVGADRYEEADGVLA
jgi:hypothetical protein